jgi:hypothetical protein
MAVHDDAQLIHANFTQTAPPSRWSNRRYPVQRQKERNTRFSVECLYISWQSYREVFRSISAKEPP